MEYIKRQDWNSIKNSYFCNLIGAPSVDSLRSYCLEYNVLQEGEVISLPDLLEEVKKEPSLWIKESLTNIANRLHELAEEARKGGVDIANDIGIYSSGLSDALEECGWSTSSMDC